MHMEMEFEMNKPADGLSQRVTVDRMEFHVSDNDDREMNPSICLLIVNMARICIEISYDFWHDQL